MRVEPCSYADPPVRRHGTESPSFKHLGPRRVKSDRQHRRDPSAERERKEVEQARQYVVRGFAGVGSTILSNEFTDVSDLPTAALLQCLIARVDVGQWNDSDEPSSRTHFKRILDS